MIEKGRCETCGFPQKCLTGEKSPINLNYRSTLSELKANVWEERNESDWSIFHDWFIRYDMEKESYLDSLKKNMSESMFPKGEGQNTISDKSGKWLP